MVRTDKNKNKYKPRESKFQFKNISNLRFQKQNPKTYHKAGENTWKSLCQVQVNIQAKNWWLVNIKEGIFGEQPSCEEKDRQTDTSPTTLEGNFSFKYI